MAPSLHLKQAFDVLALFVIPIGGGIPAGVLLAQKYGIAWPLTMLLYFVSDVLLACVFEPGLKLFVFVAKRARSWERVQVAFRKAVHRSTAHYGPNLGPLALVLIAFGVDPMTGRAAAASAGHGFVAGWMIAITGDMMYFSVLMVSTLWLRSILGDGTWTMIIILAAMILIPWLVRRVRERLQRS
jgi:hypothetical protein